MGDLSKDFSRFEWQCKCGECGPSTVDAELILILQQYVRDHYNRKVTITPNGGFRCEPWNKICEGTERSKHIKGMAADIRVESVPPQALYTYLCKKFPDKYGIGLYDTFVHLDVWPGPARRWDYRRNK